MTAPSLAGGRDGGPRADRDQGSASLFFIVALAGLLVLTGLVVDGGAKARAVSRATTLASEAARAGAQAIDVPAVLTGSRAAVDPARAQDAALAYLAAADPDGTAKGTVTGIAAVTDGGHRIAVEVTLSQPTLFLGLIGIRQLTVHGTATAVLTTGVTEPQS
jgi:hypothetical protein